MTSLNQLKREAERLTGARASIEYDDEYGTYVEIRSDEELSLERLDSICEETGAVMKPQGQNPFGEHMYHFK